MKGSWYKWGTIIYFFENFKRKKNINFQIIELIFISIFYNASKEFTFARISRKKLLIEPSVWREDDTKGGPLSTFLRISRKKKIYFQNIKPIFNSIFYKEFTRFTFARISRIKLLFQPPVSREVDTKGGPLSTFLRISRKKKILIFIIFNSFLLVYFIMSPTSLLSLEYLEKNYFLNPLFEGKMWQSGDPYLLFENLKRKKNINFQNIKFIFNSIFYYGTKDFTFARISRKKLLFEPSFWREDDTKGRPLSTFVRISREKKILIFKILNSFLILYFIKSPKSLLSLLYLEKYYFLNPPFERKMIQRGDPYLLFWEFQEKKNIYFQNIKLIFNSIFYKELKRFTFARISLKKLLFEPSFWRKDDTKGGPLSTFLRISREKKILIFKILNTFLLVYFIMSPTSLLSLEYLEQNYFLNHLFEGKMIQRGDPYLLFWEFQEKKNIYFQNIKPIFNSIFYKEFKSFTFARISLIKNYFFNPLFEGNFIQRGDHYLPFWEFQEKKKY